MSSSLNMVKTGAVAGNGTTKKVVLGFKPREVRVFNEAAGGLVEGWKTDTMETSKAMKRVPAGTATFAANMITLNSDGFTIGNDADLNAAGEKIHYVAYEGKNE